MPQGVHKSSRRSDKSSKPQSVSSTASRKTPRVIYPALLTQSERMYIESWKEGLSTGSRRSPTESERQDAIVRAYVEAKMRLFQLSIAKAKEARSDTASSSQTYQAPADAPEDAHFGADDIGWQALAPALGCCILATMVAAARWYSRARLARCVGLDDYVILLSLLLSWTMTITIGLAVHDGAGIYHSPAEARRIARLVVATNVLWILIVNITKASLLTQYLRIFCSVRTRALCFILLAALLPAVGYAVFAGVFLCRPTRKLWRPEVPGSCRSAQTYWLSVAAMDILLDTAVLLLPLPAILSLRLPSRQKAALVAVFTLGFLVCAVAIARLATVYITARRGEYVASGVWALLWSAVEANVGIVCAGLLALKPLVVKLFPRVFEKEGVPRHAMHLKAVDTSVARWSQIRRVDGERAGGAPPTPSSEDTKKDDGSEEGKRWSGMRMVEQGVSSPVSPERRRRREVSDVQEVSAIAVEGGNGGPGEAEMMSLWDVLRRPEDAVVRERSEGDGGVAPA